MYFAIDLCAGIPLDWDDTVYDWNDTIYEMTTKETHDVRSGDTECAYL